MRELKKDLFEIMLEPEVDAICITTNGNYSRQGIAFMGGGCARIAAERWEKLPKNLGKCLRIHGNNIPFIIGAIDDDGNYLEPTHAMIKEKSCKALIFSFPTINNLSDGGANIDLIKRSAQLMVDYANSYSLNGIVLGRPGVGVGNLLWVDVKKEIENILDDRFIITSFENEE